MEKVGNARDTSKHDDVGKEGLGYRPHMIAQTHKLRPRGNSSSALQRNEKMQSQSNKF